MGWIIMIIFKNRKFAVLVVVFVVVVATLLGVRGSLMRLSRDAERMFFDGVFLEAENYRQPSIDAQLNNRMSCALGFASLMLNHPEIESEAEALLSARRVLIDASSIKDKYSANERMQRAFVALANKAEKLGLSNKETEDLESYSSTFHGAQIAIRNSSYNQKAKSFMDDASILAHILRPFLFVRGPQAFA